MKERLIATNKKAYHEYFIEQTIEAGIVLVGSEVKSIRGGGVNLRDSYAVIRGGEVFLFGAHISPYKMGSFFNLDAKRDRKLLLNKGEINKLKARVEQKGYTLVVTRVYFKGALVKVELALARGKELHDKRATLKEKQLKRDVQRQLADH